jgi:signal transduction histidine kinase/streptogramin lyase/CheY-like chemotaxis protein
MSASRIAKLACCTLSWALLAVSAGADVRFERLTVQEGYPGGFAVGLAQDRQGFLWIADFEAGLIRYDGYEFRAYRHDRSDPGSISSNDPSFVHVDGTGTLWIATSTGLNRYDSTSDRFTVINTKTADPAGLSSDLVNFALVDSTGRLWVGTAEGLNRLDPGARRFRQYHVENGHRGPRQEPDNFWTGFEDSKGRLWFGSKVNGGLHLYDPQSDTLKQFVYADTPDSPAAISVRSIIEDRSGHIWIAGSTLARLDPVTMKFDRLYLRSETEHVNTLALPESAGTMWSITEDSAGNLWVTTRLAGVIQIAPDRRSWFHHTSDPNDRYSLAGDRVHSTLVDRSGQIWFAGMLGLSRYNPLADAVDYLPQPKDWLPTSIDTVFPLDDGRFLATNIGSGLWLVDPKTSVWSRLPMPGGRDAYGSVLGIAPDKSVWVTRTDKPFLIRYDPTLTRFEEFELPGTPMSFVADRQGYSWFGLLGVGLARVDPATKTVRTWMPDPESDESLGHGFVFDVLEDSRSRLWVAHENGIDLMDRTNDRFTHFWSDPDDPKALPAIRVDRIAEDESGRIWVQTTTGGISHFDADTGHFTTYPLGKSYIDLQPIGSYTPLSRGKLWWATNRGVASFDLDQRNYDVYGPEQGIPQSPNDVRAMADGRLVLGFPDRIGLFDPERLLPDPAAPTPVVTRIEMGPREITRATDEADLKIDSAPALANELTVRHDHPPLTFEFSALHYASPRANRYAHKLEGIDGDWVQTDASNRRATYTTLPPGNYTLRIKSANPSGLWGEVSTPLTLTVLPPWWRTWWAYLAYLVAAALFFTVIVQMRTRSLKTRAALLEAQVSSRTHELAEQKAIVENQARHLEQLMQTKDRLTTQISHEFRTPLTVILGPLDRLLARTTDIELRGQLDATKRNASRLLRLVNQMLGLARLRSGRSEATRPVAIRPIARQVLASFDSLARERNLDMALEDTEDAVAQSTEDALEKILVNLVSNAIKYSSAGARIRVEVAKGRDTATISVTDTGRGIAPERLPHIFEPFERAHDEAERIPGSGLGLALVHELATAHGGKVEVESTPGRGSTFRVTLPAAVVAAGTVVEPMGPSEEARLEVAALRAAHDPTQPAPATAESGHSVLVIEDNADMRAYLRQVLGGLYSVDFAEDGEAGLERAYATVPDLIVCDVMLPRKDGFEVCHALKSDDRTSHIPVIMLTALEGHEDRMKGLAERADDYLTKPFNEEELKQRIANLLDLRAMLQRRYARDLRFDQGAPADLSARDQKFLEKLSRYVGQHYADPELGLPALAAALAVSERNLQRKLKALVGLSPGEYLRGYRLQRAMERLLAGERPGDVAAAVGFASQAYFSTCFRTQYGFAPSEARARARPH